MVPSSNVPVSRAWERSFRAASGLRWACGLRRSCRYGACPAPERGFIPSCEFAANPARWYQRRQCLHCTKGNSARRARHIPESLRSVQATAVMDVVEALAAEAVLQYLREHGCSDAAREFEAHMEVRTSTSSIASRPGFPPASRLLVQCKFNLPLYLLARLGCYQILVAGATSKALGCCFDVEVTSVGAAAA